MINTEVFIVDLATAGPKPFRAEFSSFKNEPAVNALNTAKASNRRADRPLNKVSIGNSAQYHYDNKYKGERHANRSYNRIFVAHNRLSPPPE
jgi:hypothetical protein